METTFTKDQEARVAKTTAAAEEPATLVNAAEPQRIEEDAQFRAAVLEGKACADRGEFIEEDEMDTRFEQMLRS